MKVKGIKINDILEANKKVKKTYIRHCAAALEMICFLTPQARILVITPVELDPDSEDYYERLEEECKKFLDKINPATNNPIDLTEDTWKESGEEG